MEYPEAAGVDGGRGLERVDALAGRLAADQLDLLVLDEVVEGPDCVASAAHAGDQHVRDPALFLDGLGPDLPADDGLEVPDDRGERMRPHNRSEAVVGVVDAGSPLAHALGHGILEGARSGLDPADLRAHEPHPVHVESLTLHVLDAHVHHALQAHQGRGGGRRHAVLSGAGLGDEAGLAHLLGQ